MSQFADLDQVHIRCLGHIRGKPENKIEYQFAFETIDPDTSTLTASIEGGSQEIDNGLFLERIPDGTVAKFSIEGEGLRPIALLEAPEPYSNIRVDRLYEAEIECQRCHQGLPDLGYVTLSLDEIVRAANEHLKTCRPVEESE